MSVVSKYQPLNHYQWGECCDGWNLVEDPDLSVKQERMPAHSSEQMHYHRHAQQFFFILRGEAVFEIEGERISLATGQGMQVKPATRHRILNECDQDLEFLLASQPSAAADRVNCP
jgi:mannose-6-phosphate isomerase-like protein (cupin superfamily)